MSATQMYPKVTEEGLLGSTYTKTGKVVTTAAAAVFVPRPTERERVAQGLFLVGPGAEP